MKLNVKLLRQIQRRIKQEPRQFLMHSYFWVAPRIPNCGTAACIAGWAVTLTRTKSHKPADAVLKRNAGLLDVWDVAQKELGMTDGLSETLFNEESWPSQFKRRGKLADRAIRRIDHLIKTGE